MDLDSCCSHLSMVARSLPEPIVDDILVKSPVPTDLLPWHLSFGAQLVQRGRREFQILRQIIDGHYCVLHLLGQTYSFRLLMKGQDISAARRGLTDYHFTVICGWCQFTPSTALPGALWQSDDIAGSYFWAFPKWSTPRSQYFAAV